MGSIAAFLGASAVMILTWAFSIDPKIDSVDAKVDAKTELADQKYDDLKELINVQFAGSNARLERIERAMNGSLRRGDYNGSH